MVIWVELPLELPNRWYIHSVCDTPESAAEVVRILLHKRPPGYQGIRLTLIEGCSDANKIAGIPGNVLDNTASEMVS